MKYRRPLSRPPHDRNLDAAAALGRGDMVEDCRDVSGRAASLDELRRLDPLASSSAVSAYDFVHDFASFERLLRPPADCHHEPAPLHPKHQAKCNQQKQAAERFSREASRAANLLRHRSQEPGAFQLQPHLINSCHHSLFKHPGKCLLPGPHLRG